MNCCCSGRDDAARAITAPSTSRRSWLRRIGAAIEWAVPVTTLALVPKCPACVAGYVLLFTGIGVSRSAAAGLRWSIIALSVAAVSFLVLRAALRGLRAAR
jgi:hypothetical protein